MQSLWNEKEAKKCHNDPLALRVYTSRLLGKESSLVLHGGGNTSVKATVTNIFGDTDEVLYVKGSGWDLATIEESGFAPVKLDVLLKMARLSRLSDSDMVRIQRAAMTDPKAPNPSVEAILHAIIPHKFVDHTHADAVITITNTNDGEKRIQEIYGDRILIIPYVMAGFILAKKVFDMTKDFDWSKIEGIVLMNHGILSFGDDAKQSYERMINLVSDAEEYLKKQCKIIVPEKIEARENLLELARIRRAVSKTKGTAMIAKLETSPEHVSFSNLPNIATIASQGPLTPDHVIRTKRIPVIISEDSDKDIIKYSEEYHKYFERHATNELTCLDSAPRWAIWPGHGIITFGRSVKEVEIVSDIKNHTMQAIQGAEGLGGWKALPEKDIFKVEYWVLQQAKLNKDEEGPVLQGKVALVTGAASGIGRACVGELHAQGATVVALDIDKKVTKMFKEEGILALKCDVTDEKQLKKSIERTIRSFGGLDVVISNAGIFPVSEKIVEMKKETWNQSMSINLSSHRLLLQSCIPYLSLGVEPTVIFIGSKNVPAPGPGVSAYSVAKAGLTQLARVAALELAPMGVRVNIIHPNQVFDTAIWTPEVLQKRADHYKMSIEEYKKSNLLGVEITSKDVAQLVCTMAGPVFAKTTGTQVSIDGGNERVI